MDRAFLQRYRSRDIHPMFVYGYLFLDMADIFQIVQRVAIKSKEEKEDDGERHPSYRPGKSLRVLHFMAFPVENAKVESQQQCDAEDKPPKKKNS